MDRNVFLRLPIEERRKLLEQQAGDLKRVYDALIEFAYMDMERCEVCGNPVALIWTAKNEDWERYRQGHNALCPVCFDSFVEELNPTALVRWVPQIEGDDENLRDMSGSAFVEGWLNGEEGKESE